MTLTKSKIKTVKAELAAWLEERDRPAAVRKLASDVLHDLDALLIEPNPAMQGILAEDVAKLGWAAGRPVTYH